MVKEKYLPLEEPTPVPVPELTSAEKRKSKWDNFWYYHKKTFWVVLFAIIAIVYISDPFTQNITPDYTITVISGKYWTNEHIERFEKAMEPYGEDLNGDGQVVFSADYYLLPENTSSLDPEQLQASLIKLAAGFQTCDSMLYLCDTNNADFYGIYSGAFCRLDDYSIVPEEDKNTKVEDIGYEWQNLNVISQHPYFKTSKTEMYFCLRALAGTALEHEDTYNDNRALLERIMTNTPTNPDLLLQVLEDAEKEYAEAAAAASSVVASK